MAIWQFDVEFVPRSWLKRGGSLSEFVGPDGSSTTVAWAAFAPAADDVHDIAVSVLGAPSFTDDDEGLTQWGDDTVDRYDMFRVGQMVEAFFVRINAYAYALDPIIEIALKLDCDLWPRGAEAIVVADGNALRSAVVASKAGQFALAVPDFMANRLDERERRPR